MGVEVGLVCGVFLGGGGFWVFLVGSLGLGHFSLV